MNSFRILAATASVAFAANCAVAQCSNYSLSPAGTVILDADDAILNIGLPFAFPFNGTTYTSVTVSTNGWIKLGTSATTGSDLGDTEALMLSAEPRIAVCWDDLNAGATGSGEIYYAFDGNQASFTWQNVQRYGATQTGTLANCECVLTAAGEIFLVYDSSCTFNLSNSSSIVGISAGGGTVTAGTHLVDWSTSNPGPIGVVDGTAYELFPTGTFDLLGGVTIAFLPTGVGTYNAIQVPTLPACSTQTYPPLSTTPMIIGAGCPKRAAVASIYESFTTDTGANPVDTQNTSLHFTPSGTNYVMTPGTGFDGSYTTGTNAGIAGDDVTVQVPITGMTSGFPFVNLTVTSVGICSNGFLWLDASTGTDLSPTDAEFNSQGPRIAGCWKDHNLNPTSGGGTVYVNDTAAYFMVTWENVFEYANPTVISTFQIKMWANGDIDINTLGTASASDNVIVGITRGGSTNLVESDLVTAGQVNVAGPVDMLATPGTEVPMTHSATALRIGQNWTLSATVGANNGIGLFVIGFTPTTLPLDFLGMTGCTLYQSLDILHLALINGNSFSEVAAQMPFNVSLTGLTLYTQAAALSNDNAFGIITSNGMVSTSGL